MTLKDVSHGPDWLVWIIFAILAVAGVVLLSGRGAFLIAGYNTASEKNKQKIDSKKLCRVMGAGLLVIAVLILVMGVGESVLPAWFAYLTLGIILADCAAVIILANTVCKRK